MAVLTATQLADMRKELRKSWITPIDFTKTTINTAFQTLEDEYEDAVAGTRKGFEAEGGELVVAAVAPVTFTNPELKRIGGGYLAVKLNI